MSLKVAHPICNISAFGTWMSDPRIHSTQDHAHFSLKILTQGYAFSLAVKMLIKTRVLHIGVPVFNTQLWILTNENPDGSSSRFQLLA